MPIDPQQRRQGIGGSDVAAILGYSPWIHGAEVYVLADFHIEEAAAAAHARYGHVTKRAKNESED